MREVLSLVFNHSRVFFSLASGTNGQPQMGGGTSTQQQLQQTRTIAHWAFFSFSSFKGRNKMTSTTIRINQDIESVFILDY